jgi:hypothetical protein
MSGHMHMIDEDKEREIKRKQGQERFTENLDI